MTSRIVPVFIFMLIGLFALAGSSTSSVSNAAESLVFPAVNASPESENITSYPLDFTIFENAYTAVVVTNSELSDLAMSETGMGIQFQVNVPSETAGFCNATVPAILIGTEIAVFEDGVLLEENVRYTQQRSGPNYIFHLTFGSGTHLIVIEAAMVSAPTASPQQNQSGLPIEMVIAVAAVGVVAAAGVAVYYLGLKGGANAAKPPLPPGGGSVNVQAGANVAVQPHPKVKLTFAQVNQAGAATATPVSSYPPLPKGMAFRGDVFDVKTASVFTGLVVVGLLFDAKDLSEEKKKKLRVYRNDLKEGSGWEDVTQSIDAENNIAYGATDHFSLFGVR